MEMRPLKDYVERYLQQNREIKKAERDPVLDGLKEIVEVDLIFSFRGVE
jgi:hypothetical protein